MSQGEDEEKDPSLITMRGEEEDEEIEVTIEVKGVEAMITIVEIMTMIEEETLGETTTTIGEETTLITGNEAMEIGVTMMINVANEAVVVIEMTLGAKRKI
jgi:hypothetical protein